MTTDVTDNRCDHTGCNISANYGDGFGTCSRCGGRIAFYTLPGAPAAKEPASDVLFNAMSSTADLFCKERDYWKDHYTGTARRCEELAALLAARDARIAGLEEERDALEKLNDIQREQHAGFMQFVQGEKDKLTAENALAHELLLYASDHGSNLDQAWADKYRALLASKAGE